MIITQQIHTNSCKHTCKLNLFRKILPTIEIINVCIQNIVSPIKDLRLCFQKYGTKRNYYFKKKESFLTETRILSKVLTRGEFSHIN
jgi:hypothetical protein